MLGFKVNIFPNRLKFKFTLKCIMVSGYYQNLKLFSRNVKIFLLGNAIQGMGLSIYSLLFNLYLKELGFKESAIGGLISTTSLGISFMAIPAALIIERFHVKHLVLTGMSLASFFYFIQIHQITEGSLFFFGLMASMFQALFNISVSPFYLRNSTKKMRVQLFTLNSGLNIFAHLIGYLIGGFIPQLFSLVFKEAQMVELYRYSLLAAITIVASSNFIFLRIKRVPVPVIARKKIFEELKAKEWALIFKLALPKLLLAFGGGMVIPFMNIYLKDKFHFSTEKIGASYAMLQFFIFVGILISPYIVKKMHQLKFMMMSSLLSVPFMISMGVTPYAPFVLACFFLRGMLMNMSSPITNVFEMEKVKEHECAFASAVLLFSYHFVYSLSTRIGGGLIEMYSFGPTFYIGAFFYALSSFSYYHFFKQDLTSQESEQKFKEVSAA